MVHSSRPKRHFIKRRRADAHLEERDPSLINLPIPLPTIPIISNLLDPLISGEKASSSSSTQAAAPTATSTPASSGNTSTSSSGNNSASSSDSGDSTSSSSDTDTGSESGSSSSSSGNGSGSDAEPASAASSTAASVATAVAGNPGSFVDTTGSSTASVQGASASSAVATAAASASAAATGTAATESTVASVENGSVVGTETSTASTSSSTAIANNIAVAVDNDNDNGSSSAAVHGTVSASGSTAQATAIGTLGTGVGSTSSSGSGSGSSSVTDSTSSSADAANSSLSGGAIAGIILAVLLAGGLLVLFVMRRRAMNKRKERQTAWFFGRNTTHPPVDPAARISTRSSWGTPFDGRALYTDATSPTPDSAPNTMAQINAAPLTAPPGVVTQKSNERASMYSIGSASSEGSGTGEVLPMPAAVHGDDMPSTPMSVRPFSPSDDFSFPKPPTSTGTSKKSSRQSLTDLIDLNNPFADPLPKGASPFADPVVPATPGARTSVGSSVVSAGSVIGIGTRVTIARPFTPNLHDEMAVTAGDEVVVLQAFDDGWVQIRNAAKDVGLIPLDCFRAEGQDVPTFIASKRVSSFFQAGFLQ